MVTAVHLLAGSACHVLRMHSKDQSAGQQVKKNFFGVFKRKQGSFFARFEMGNRKKSITFP